MFVKLVAALKCGFIAQLDTDVIEKAKKEHINISRFAEEALRQALEIRTTKTAQKYLQKMLAEIGREDSFHGETYLLSSK